MSLSLATWTPRESVEECTVSVLHCIMLGCLSIALFFPGVQIATIREEGMGRKPAKAAAVRRPVPASASAADRAWESSEAKGPKRLRGTSAESRAARAVLDNLKDVPKDLLHNTLVQGRSMFQRLVDDKRKNIQVRGSIKFSKAYYRSLKRDYKRDTDPESRLPRGIAPSATCLAAFRKAFAACPSRQDMRDYLGTVEVMGQGDVIATCQLILHLSPSSSRDQLYTQCEAACCLYRLNIRGA